MSGHVSCAAQVGCCLCTYSGHVSFFHHNHKHSEKHGIRADTRRDSTASTPNDRGGSSMRVSRAGHDRCPPKVLQLDQFGSKSHQTRAAHSLLSLLTDPTGPRAPTSRFQRPEATRTSPILKKGWVPRGSPPQTRSPHLGDPTNMAGIYTLWRIRRHAYHRKQACPR